MGVGGAPVTPVDKSGNVIGPSGGVGPAATQLPASLGTKTAANSLSVTPASDSTYTVVGNVAALSTDSGPPVKIGAVANDPPAAVAAGQRTNLQTDLRSRLHVTVGPTGSSFSGYDQESIDNQPANAGAIALRANAFVYGFDGTNKVRMRGDTNGLVVTAALGSQRWVYAAPTAGLSNTTTAVTVMSAAGVGVRNYIRAVQIDHDLLTTATEFAIRDGAAGTVLWRRKFPAGAAGSREVNFDVPLRGTANTLLEIVTLTASGAGAVFFNAQGFQGS